MIVGGLLEALDRGSLVGDGGLGTTLLSRGFTARRPLDRLNLEDPGAVRALHREFRAAGARVLKTNTFLASRLRMPRGRVRDLNLAGAALAKREAGRDGFVLGVIGPPPPGARSEALFDAMREQARALADGGVDGLLLEVGLDEVPLRLATGAARAAGLPCFAEGAPVPGLTAQWAAALLGARSEADGVGVHCAFPDEVLRVLGRLPGRLRSAYPCASLPGGRRLAPETFARAGMRLTRAGVRLVGGCCGAGPEHIRALAGRIGS